MDVSPERRPPEWAELPEGGGLIGLYADAAGGVRWVRDPAGEQIGTLELERLGMQAPGMRRVLSLLRA
jgi:hypothetical protein